MPATERTSAVLGLLEELPKRRLEALKDLFWVELNYERVNQPLSADLPETAKAKLEGNPLLLASTSNGEFQIIYSHLACERLLLAPERLVVSKLLLAHPYALFVFSNRTQDRWHFVNVREEATPEKRRLFRRITVGPEERLRTASERIAMLDVTDQTLPPLYVQQQHDRAFDVEAVTKAFFDDYQEVFTALQTDLRRQTKDQRWAHDYALQFLNRLMFLYFVQRKRWLGENTEFLRAFWKAYENAKRPKDTFFSEWLLVLFFEAFNNRFHGGQKHFPPEIRKHLAMAPYLNGGLFTKNELDQRHTFKISDERFRQAFDFLEGYNFTIAEDSPLDQEVAVDPVMLGKVYESLVNVSSETDERGDAGIFYTPRTEIDLMCRLALVDNLSNHLGHEHKERLYDLVFALEEWEKEEADRNLAQAGLWAAVNRRLREITVVDPACGSGSFLVGMLHVLDDLQRRAETYLRPEPPESPYERKKRIIGQNLYGVDVMEWACHVAELRLWLALIIDAEFSREELHVRREPLLPHFTFKIRCGDSLVQEIGGVNLTHIRASKDISGALRTRITRHKHEKLAFYENRPSREYRRPEDGEHRELQLFREVVTEKLKSIQEDIKSLVRKIARPVPVQMGLDGTAEPIPHPKAIEWERELEQLSAEYERVKQARDALRNAKDVPFVWDIAFVEVFEGEAEGFDIVIGNPPYVRQEKIADPRQPRDKITVESKREYKAKLANSVYRTYPKYFFRFRTEQKRTLGAKNDLYVYFYLHGLSLLNPRGSFCFITSNSWLDVGYGADLQEFLLRNCRIHLILDNQVRRSFADADINTVIVLCSAPQKDEEAVLSHTARFVMCTVPFEHIVSPIVFREIEDADSRRSTPEYRVHPISQRAMLEEGMEERGIEPKDDEESTSKRTKKGVAPLIHVPKYGGNKWGGKYLRAPDIYWRILEKGKDKLVRLGDIAEVRRGITTGANDFFYLPSRYFDIERDGDYYRLIPKEEGLPRGITIEAHFLRMPLIQKTKEIFQPEICTEQLAHRILLVSVPQNLLRRYRLWQYVRWGEGQRYHRRPTCAARARTRPWYALVDPGVPDLLVPIGHKRRPVVGIPSDCLADANFNEVRLRNRVAVPLVAATMYSSFSMLQYELIGRANFGQGLLKTQTYELQELLVLEHGAIGAREAHALVEAFRHLAKRPPMMIYDEVRSADRQAMEEAFLIALGFTEAAERRRALHDLHDATCRMIWHRMSKSNSARESRMTYDEWLATGEPFGMSIDEDEE